MTEYIKGTSPVGRMLAGAIFEKTDKGFQGKILDTPIHYLQLAVPKTSPELATMFDDMKGASTAFKNGEPSRADFSWKYKDGDTMPDREGAGGCYIFRFSTHFDVGVYDMDYKRILDKNAVKPGYQVRVAYSTISNENRDKPGIYLNIDMVQLVAQDKEIATGVDPRQVFTTPARALPPQPGTYQQPPAQSQQPPAQSQQPPVGAYQQPPAQSQQPPVYEPDPSFLNGF